MNKYPIRPTPAQIIAGIRAGIRRVTYGIARNIKKNIANITAEYFTDEIVELAKSGVSGQNVLYKLPIN